MAARTHNLANCRLLDPQDRRQIVRAALVLLDEDQHEEGTAYPDPHYEAIDEHLLDEVYDQELTDTVHDVTNKFTYQYSSVNPPAQSRAVTAGTSPKINLVSVYESPILACSCNETTIYIVLDSGATCSLVSLSKARQLGLTISKTYHKAVQVDGRSPLQVVGEVHTQFYRGSLTLAFSGLVIAEMATDIIGGTNFIIENDISYRMSKNSISMGSSTVMAAPPTVLALDTLDTRLQLVRCQQSVTLVPGDYVSLPVPADFPSVGFAAVEPNTTQTTDFFSPAIVPIESGHVVIKNESSNVVKLPKNCQPLHIRRVTDRKTPTIKIPSPDDLAHLSTTPRSATDILKDISIDDSNTLAREQRKPFISSITKYLTVFQPDLPGYNGVYGQVQANFEFASSARPASQKLHTPSYGSQGQLLLHQKFLQMHQKGILIDPLAYGIQPAITNNSWLVKKPSAARTPWDQCTAKDVRVVVGFDKLNKFLKDPPGKVTKSEEIYSSLASWKVMGEMDFSYFYFQLPFRLDTAQDRSKISYLCIRTSMGTLAYSRAPMGLLGMDVWQDELTDRLFGDLVLAGRLVKLTDNIYFGGQTIEEMHHTFDEILRRCSEADLRIKPSKVKLNIVSADILGLHWTAGRITPSRHKLDPLANCDQPVTVSGLRGWLGGVRFNQVCLPGANLAAATQPLDEQVPSSRSGKEKIVWTPALLQSFKHCQTILRSPLHVTIPKKGDTPYLVTDACTSLPAGGTKLFLQRPGVQGFLPSFNWGCRLPATMKQWPPHDIEAFFLSHGIQKNQHFIRTCEKPGVAFVDSKATFQASQRLHRGEFSTSKRLNDLLANLSSKRMTIQLISAKLPSPLLAMVDFASRNPVECDVDTCNTCHELLASNTTFFGRVFSRPNSYLASIEAWRDIQQSCPDLRRAHALLQSGKGLEKGEEGPRHQVLS